MSKKVVSSVTKTYGCTNEALEEEYYVVGDGAYGCIRIEYHEPTKEDNRHYCDVIRENETIRLFEPTSLSFKNIG